MTKAELMGPSAIPFWLSVLREADTTPNHDFLTLEDAATQLGCQPNDLLDKGLIGELALYAPVLHEALYSWPVTERGQPHARLLGNRGDATPIFQERLQYGDYAMLLSADLKKIKIEQSVKPEGYVCPERVQRLLLEWEVSQQEKPSTSLIDRLKRLANQVAWIPAFPPEKEVGTVKLGMLRVDSSDVQRLESAVIRQAESHESAPNESLKHSRSTDNKEASTSIAVRSRIMAYPFRGEMSSAIVIAISKARNPESHHSVWEELLKLAEQQVAPLLDDPNKTGKIRFRNNGGTVNTYEKSSLQKSLGRAVQAANSPTGSHKTP